MSFPDMCSAILKILYTSSRMLNKWNFLEEDIDCICYWFWVSCDSEGYFVVCRMFNITT